MDNIVKLSELAEYLRRAAGIFSQSDYEYLYQGLHARYEQLIIEAILEHHPGWSIVEGNSACTMFLYRNWVFSKKTEVNARRLLDLADVISENYQENTNIFLTRENAQKVLQISDRVYDLSNRVFKNKHTFIFLFKATYRNEDSFCRSMKFKDGSVSADIYMLIPHIDHEATPESMFLHELGHCINLALTGNMRVAPEDFSLVLSAIGAKWGDIDVSEFFAHFFAMSILIESELKGAEPEPFSVVPLNHKEMFRAYFRLKLQSC